MKNLLQHPQFGNIRIEKDQEGVWFCAQDVCKALEYQNHKRALKQHCREKGVTKRTLLTSGGKQEVLFIDEGNLYRLTIKSHMKQARLFEDWVCDEVLPSIRKYGKYEPIEQQELAPIELEWYNGQLCVASHKLIESGIITKDNISSMVSRGGLQRARRGGNGRRAMIVYSSIPERFKQKIKIKGVFVQDSFHLMQQEPYRSIMRDICGVNNKSLRLSLLEGLNKVVKRQINDGCYDKGYDTYGHSLS